MSANVLIVEDETAIVDFLRDNLVHDEHRVRAAGTVRDALKELAAQHFDIALVDVGLPDGSGLDVVRAIRGGEAGDPGIGVIVLTARTEEQDRLRGFQRGADDYVAKPFGYPELLARIVALHDRLRRATRRDVLTVGEIEIDVLARSVRVAGKPMPLPAKEFELLAALARDPERVIPKGERLSREDLVAITNSYFDGLSAHDGKLIIAHTGCVRVENGSLTTQRPIAGGGETDCTAEGPMTNIFAVTARRYLVVDPEAGAVLGLALFQRKPGVQMRRNLLGEWFFIEQGKIREVYAAMYYPDPAALVPNWPPFDGNWPPLPPPN